MLKKPTYEELEQRVQEFEKSHFERKRAEEQLREVKELNEGIVQTINDGIVLTDTRGIITFVNPALAALLGCAPERLIGRLWLDFVPPDQRTIARTADERRSTAQANLYELTLQREDGSRLSVLVGGNPRFDKRTGQYAGTLGVITDISDHKRAEQELRASEALFRNLFEQHAAVKLIIDPDSGNIIDTNHAAEKFYGWTREQLQQMRIQDINTLAPEQVKQEMEKARTNKQIHFEFHHRLSDGSIRDVEVFSNKIEAKGKDLLYSVVHDITDRKQAEAELRRTQQTLLTVLDSIDATVYVADMQSYEILFMNKRMIDAFGGDFTGRICYEAFRGETMPCGHCTNERLLDADGRPTGVCVWENRNPLNEKWYINHDRAIRWLDGRMVRLQIAFDVTMLKEMEQDRKRIGEQLIQAQKMESVGRLAGGVAHDFNNMLGAILGYTELGISGVNPTDPIYRTLQDIQKAAQRSVNLTRQLLAFARKQTVAPRVLDINETLEGMLKMLRRLIGEDIELAWRPGKDLGPVRMDPSQIEQVLANLFVNARDAIHDTGRITVETSAAAFDETYCAAHVGSVAGEYMLLAVSDNGCGMNDETLSHLFEPFFTTKEVGKGTGLGLATVYGIVKQNNGFINVYSEPGLGTTFKIYFPRHVTGAGRITKMDATQPAAHGHETILLVEDEPMILDIATTMLERQGYTVLSAATPGEAIRLAREHAGEIHLLMTDVVMPEMNGRDLAKNLLSLYPNLKRLFMSGYTANVIAHHGVLDEGVQFIQKPFTVQTLAVKVREVLDETKWATQ